MAFNDIYRLRIYQRMHAQTVINVLHFKEDLPVTGTGAAALALDFRDSMGVALRGRACTELFFDYIEVQRIIPWGDTPMTAVFTPATAGTVAGTGPTGAIAEVFTLFTGQIGRRKRGRIYLSGLGQSRMIAGSTTVGQQTNSQTLAVALMNRYCVVPYTSSWALGVWSRVLGGQQPPLSTNGFAPVTSITVRTTLRSQRRRQLGVGR
jgi:hypothetical protein